MSRTSRGDTETRPVSTRLILDAEHSSRSATSSHVSLADSRSRRSSSASRRRRTVGLCVLATYPSLGQLALGQLDRDRPVWLGPAAASSAGSFHARCNDPALTCELRNACCIYPLAQAC